VFLKWAFGEYIQEG